MMISDAWSTFWRNCWIFAPIGCFWFVGAYITYSGGLHFEWSKVIVGIALSVFASRLFFETSWRISGGITPHFILPTFKSVMQDFRVYLIVLVLVGFAVGLYWLGIPGYVSSALGVCFWTIATFSFFLTIREPEKTVFEIFDRAASYFFANFLRLVWLLFLYFSLVPGLIFGLGALVVIWFTLMAGGAAIREYLEIMIGCLTIVFLIPYFLSWGLFSAAVFREIAHNEE